MAQQSMVQTELGEALRQLADRVDQVPVMTRAKKYPTVPAQIGYPVRTREAVALLARDFGTDVHTHDTALGLLSFFDVDCGEVRLHVFSLNRDL